MPTQYCTTRIFSPTASSSAPRVCWEGQNSAEPGQAGKQIVVMEPYARGDMEFAAGWATDGGQAGQDLLEMGQRRDCRGLGIFPLIDN